MTDGNTCFPVIRKPGPVRVWKEVEVKKKDGDQSLKFVIQEIPEDRQEDILDVMTTHFIPDEPLCNAENAKDDPVFVDDLRNVWRMILRQGISVVAFAENPDGGKPIIAGCNILGVEFRDNEAGVKDFKTKSAGVEKLLNVVMSLGREADVFRKYDIDRVMFAFGLVVNRDYRGYALGGHILSARDNIGREYKIPATVTTFTSPISQKLAARVGFETLVERDCADMVDENGKKLYPNVKMITLKLMAKRLY